MWIVVGMRECVLLCIRCWLWQLSMAGREGGWVLHLCEWHRENIVSVEICRCVVRQACVYVCSLVRNCAVHKMHKTSSTPGQRVASLIQLAQAEEERVGVQMCQQKKPHTVRTGCRWPRNLPQRSHRPWLKGSDASDAAHLRSCVRAF